MEQIPSILWDFCGETKLPQHLGPIISYEWSYNPINGLINGVTRVKTPKHMELFHPTYTMLFRGPSDYFTPKYMELYHPK